jgi:putative flippase GtrA
MNAPETNSPARRLIRALSDRAFMTKAATFGAIGVVNSAVDFAVFTLAFVWLALPIIPSNLMSWAVAVTFSYVLNSMFTFAAESGRKLAARTYLSFVAAQVAGFIANTATIFVVSYFLERFAGVDANHAVLFGKLLAIGVSFVVNFSLSHFVVFRRRGGPFGQDAAPPSRPPSSSV